MMRILCIGDIVGRIGRDMVFSYLDRNKDNYDLIEKALKHVKNMEHFKEQIRKLYKWVNIQNLLILFGLVFNISKMCGFCSS